MRPGRRNALLLGGAGLAAAAAGLGLFALLRERPPQLLATRFPDLEGHPRRLTDWRGKVVVCNFWATWCAPCREEIPLLIAAKHKYARREFEVVGIGIDRADNLREFAAKFAINYPILVGDTRAIDLMRELGNQAGALPYTVLLDAAGTVTARKTGAFRRDELEQVLRHSLG